MLKKIVVLQVKWIIYRGMLNPAYLIPAAIAPIPTHVSTHHRGRWCCHRNRGHTRWDTLNRSCHSRAIIHFTYFLWVIIVTNTKQKEDTEHISFRNKLACIIML